MSAAFRYGTTVCEQRRFNLIVNNGIMAQSMWHEKQLIVKGRSGVHCGSLSARGYTWAPSQLAFVVWVWVWVCLVVRKLDFMLVRQSGNNSSTFKAYLPFHLIVTIPLLWAMRFVLEDEIGNQSNSHNLHHDIEVPVTFGCQISGKSEEKWKERENHFFVSFCGLHSKSVHEFAISGCLCNCRMQMSWQACTHVTMTTMSSSSHPKSLIASTHANIDFDLDFTMQQIIMQ